MPPSRKGHAKAPAALSQAIAVQKLIASDAQQPDLAAKDRAALARAWCDLNEEIRKLKMKPLPKPIDVSHKASRTRKPPRAWTDEPIKESLSKTDPSGHPTPPRESDATETEVTPLPPTDMNSRNAQEKRPGGQGSQTTH